MVAVVVISGYFQGVTWQAIELRPSEFNFDEPWTRQPFDTENRWAAFIVFRELTPPRTIRGASVALADPATLRPFDVSTLELWSASYAWVERCAEYDRYIDRRRVEATIEILQEDARTTAGHHIKILRDAQTAAASVVADWLRRLARGEVLDGWAPNDVRGMIKDCIALERLVRGQATERVEHGIVDLTNLSLEEVETLHLLEAKAGVVE